jgi:hypothetical protein
MRLLPLVALLLAAPLAVAQAPADTTHLERVELVDGSTLVGVVIAETATDLTLRTSAGIEVTVPLAQIRRRVSFAGRIEGGRVVVHDPNRTRLLFTPTARALGAGEGYLAAYQVFLPFVAFGITDQVSLAGGTVLLPGAFGRVWYVAPKVTFYEREDLAVGVGGLGIGVFVEDERFTAGLGYGLVTYGGPERSLTAGAGFAFAEGGLSSGLIVTIGGELQLSNSLKLITENYLLPWEDEVSWDPVTGRSRYETKYEALLGVGIRFFGQRLAVDLAGFTSPSLVGEDLFPFLPWVGFAYNFGR